VEHIVTYLNDLEHSPTLKEAADYIQMHPYTLKNLLDIIEFPKRLSNLSL
jgi:hypothetical protein